MRIAAVTPYDLATPGGVNQQALLLARAWRAAGHEVRLFGPASDAAAAPPDVTVLGRARRVPGGRTEARLSASAWVVPRVRRIVAAGDFDVLHVHEPCLPLLPYAFLHASRALAVGTFHSADALGPHLYRWLRPGWTPFARRLDLRTVPSPVAAERAGRFITGPWAVLPNAVDVDRFAAPAACPPGLDDDRPTILFLGRQEPRKGLGTLLDAYARVREEVVGVRLVVVGPPGPRGASDRRRVRRLGWDDVLFTGPVPDAARSAYYQTASVFCAPALGEESFGVVLAEAMAAGTPVVASAIPGYRYVLEDGRCGVLVPPGDAAALAGALVSTLRSPERRSDLRARGGERVQAFRVERVAAEYAGLFARGLEARRARRS